MNAPIPNDGPRANNTNLTFTSRSELANQLLLLSQSQELLPKYLEVPIVFQVLDLPFIDDVDRQIYYRHLIDERIEWYLRGASWNSILRRTNEWYEAQRIERASPNLTSKWKEKSYPGFEWKDTDEIRYTITELTTAKALRQEGFNMQHCVATYQSKCVSGQSAIWSLSKWENQLQERMLTIEVNARQQIVQMKGLNNRNATSFERNLVQQWALIAKLEIIKGV